MLTGATPGVDGNSFRRSIVADRYCSCRSPAARIGSSNGPSSSLPVALRCGRRPPSPRVGSLVRNRLRPDLPEQLWGGHRQRNLLLHSSGEHGQPYHGVDKLGGGGEWSPCRCAVRRRRDFADREPHHLRRGSKQRAVPASFRNSAAEGSQSCSPTERPAGSTPATSM